MSWLTTNIALSSVASVIVATSRLAGASLTDPVTALIANAGAQLFYVGGSDMTTANLGIPVTTNGVALQLILLSSDPLFGISTAGTPSATVAMDRQKGSAA